MENYMSRWESTVISGRLVCTALERRSFSPNDCKKSNSQKIWILKKLKRSLLVFSLDKYNETTKYFSRISGQIDKELNNIPHKNQNA
jgi:hypothetical protein